MRTTDVAAASVIDLESHPAWCAAQRRAHAMEEAMRRHPSYQSRMAAPSSVLHSV